MKQNIIRRNDIFLIMSLFKSLALPHPHHKKRSFLLQPKAFIGYFIFILALLYISYEITTTMPRVLGYAENVNITDLLVDTNKMRADRGLGELKLNAVLSRAAEAKAKDMFAKNYWAHNSPDGKEPWDFIIAAGYDYLYAGENLAVDFNNSQGVVDAWYESPSHRENLLNKKYSEIGFAVLDGELEGRKTTLVVQMFGYPRVRQATVSSATTTSEEPVLEAILPHDETKPEPVTEEVPAAPPEVREPAKSETPQTIGIVLNASDVLSFSRYIALIFGLFVTALFAIDGYYIKKMGVFRISGHTILHVLMLIAAIVGIWYTQFGLVL